MVTYPIVYPVTRINSSVIGVERKKVPIFSLDSDVEAFQTLTGATDVSGLNDLAVYLKRQSRWASTRFYPMKAAQNYGTGSTVAGLGGLDSSTMTLVNTPTWGSSSVTFKKTTNDHAFSSSAGWGGNGAFFAKTITSPSSTIEEIVNFQDLRISSGPRLLINDANLYYADSDSAIVITQPSTDYDGLFMVNIDAGNVRLLIDGSLIATTSGTTNASLSPLTLNGFIQADGSPRRPVNQTCSLVGYINTPLTTTQEVALSTLINAL